MCDQHRFVFEFDKAYNQQLIEKFKASPNHALTQDVAPPLKGVYALYHRGDLVYAGPTTNIWPKTRIQPSGAGSLDALVARERRAGVRGALAERRHRPLAPRYLRLGPRERALKRQQVADRVRIGRRLLQGPP